MSERSERLAERMLGVVALTGHFANQCNAAMTEVLEYLDTL